jgi:hypothetical protein
MLEVDSELNTNIGAYEILHPLTKNEIFSAYKQGFMNFMLMIVVLSESESCHEWVFVVHILLVNLCEQAYEYVFNENSTFQMVGSTRSTPNSFDALGSGDLSPPLPMTPVETSWPPKPKCCAKSYRSSSKSLNRCNRDLQWELVMMDHSWLPPTPSLSGWSPNFH